MELDVSDENVINYIDTPDRTRCWGLIIIYMIGLIIGISLIIYFFLLLIMIIAVTPTASIPWWKLLAAIIILILVYVVLYKSNETA